MQTTLKRMLLVVAAIALAACSKLTASNFEQIQNNMTPDQVKAILGEPAEIKSGGFLGFNGTVYVYRKDNTEVTVTFVQDKVIAKDGSFAKK
jgi:transcription antitermination factor NusG